MKNLKSVISLLLIFVMLISAAGCGGTEDVYSEWIELVEVSSDDASSSDVSSSEELTSSDDTVTAVTPGGNTSTSNIVKDNIHITANGKTKYKIVVSLSNDGYDEGRLMQKVIKAISDTSVPLILDTENYDGPEIIIGDTTREESKALSATLGANEYAIKADKQGNITIVGKTAYALKLGVEKFMTDYFGYDRNATKIEGKEKAVPVTLNIRQSMLSNYKLVWNDEFEGTAVDKTKWCFVPHMKEQTHLKLRHDESAVKVENGCMNLISGRIDNENYWTNTSLSTSETMVFKYGYLEMRAKVPFGAPAFPSFWMQSNSYNADDPLIMSEVDMFEHFCSQGDDYLQTGIHKWYRDGSGDHFVSAQIGKFNFGSEELAEQWHTYSLLWTEESMTFMVDGEAYHTIDITSSGDFGDRGDGMGAFHDYHHLIFNNYVHTSDGSEEGNVDKDNASPDDEFPIKYVIDYVRLYQLPGQGDVAEIYDK